MEEANLESRSPSPKYPRLAWLNGIWCSTSVPWRWQVVGPNQLRMVVYYDKNNIRERDVPIEEKDGYYEIRSRGFGGGEDDYTIYRIRKDSDTQYTQIYYTTFENGKKKREGESTYTSERCWIE